MKLDEFFPVEGPAFRKYAENWLDSTDAAGDEAYGSGIA